MISLSNIKYLDYFQDILTELMVGKMNSFSKEEFSEKKYLLNDLIFNEGIKAICLLLQYYFKNENNFEQVLNIVDKFLEALELKE